MKLTTLSLALLSTIASVANASAPKSCEILEKLDSQTFWQTIQIPTDRYGYGIGYVNLAHSPAENRFLALHISNSLNNPGINRVFVQVGSQPNTTCMLDAGDFRAGVSVVSPFTTQLDGRWWDGSTPMCFKLYEKDPGNYQAIVECRPN